MGDRRSHTTLELLGAAVAEVIERGHAALTMEGISRRAYYSIGTVYERWDNREAVLTSIAQEALPGRLDATSTHEDDLHFRLLVTELLLASGNIPSIRGSALDALHGYLKRHNLPSLDEPEGWWAAATLLGDALLRVGGAELPDMHVVVRRTLEASRQLPTVLPSAQPPESSAPSDLSAHAIPPTPFLTRNDDTAKTLRAAAERLIISDGVTGAETREIASAAGVTTGAIYRRYSSKSELLGQVLAARLQADRYEWSHQLVAAVAEYGDEPLVLGAFIGGLVGERLWATASSESERRLLLGITVAARSNPDVQRQVMGQITAVQESREGLLTALVDAGLLDSHVDVPAATWLLQAPPVGGRLLAECGVLLEHDSLVDMVARSTVVTLFPGISALDRDRG